MTCPCGSPAVDRKPKSALEGLCWLCGHLKASAIAEAKQDAGAKVVENALAW